nr:hypothetical protein [Nanoarchaeota archaeon]
MRNKIILLALFILFGIFLLRGGITGFVISESCCFGPECAPENMCPVEPSLQRPAMLSSEDNNALSVVGLLIIVISVLMIFGYLKKKVRKDKEE